MKKLLLPACFPLFSFAQYEPNEILPYRVRIISDSGIVKGYFVSNSDSAIIVSSTKRYLLNSTIKIPVSNISKLDVKNKTGTSILGAALASVFGFTLAAGLTKNSGDVDNDGKTSFWELLFTAIESTTSANRKRRNTAFFVGAAGGTTAMVIGMLANKKMSLVFPINNRYKFFMEKKYKINEFVKF
jgi:hypothetical protein